jgi:hypothetical protein
MANTANSITADSLTDACTRTLIGFVGATGNLDFGRHFNNWDTIALQCTGTFDSATVTVNVSEDGVTYFAPATAVSFSAAGRKTIALADLGFKFLRLVMASGAGSANIAYVIVCSRRNDRAKPE